MKENPYNRLKAKFLEYVDAVEYRHREDMFKVSKGQLSGPHTMADIFERTMAAQQIGYDVVLRASGEGLLFQYIKKIPDRPWEVR
jgi:hypothetical protein